MPTAASRPRRSARSPTRPRPVRPVVVHAPRGLDLRPSPVRHSGGTAPAAIAHRMAPARLRPTGRRPSAWAPGALTAAARRTPALHSGARRCPLALGPRPATTAAIPPPGAYCFLVSEMENKKKKYVDLKSMWGKAEKKQRSDNNNSLEPQVASNDPNPTSAPTIESDPRIANESGELSKPA
ncbi:hypothetical protein GUJ93_ZPchr0005g15662 [Zizania palustris]|uniref:Uncharacterized protein n=1 Tax=Zizania palustris TaxID=103762 RepID=A0A8J5W0P8_ZIZPA|nr:hypothetical protein GUJ93_ZPchr0005g14861 [Zizania palustris]KAG8068238.1 hypothetical protein GUJ93_ZPchr0005g15662 [Zizania palustris]